jgi:putative transposase
VANVHALIAVGVNAEGYREILGLDVTTAEDGAGWLTFLRSLTARGLSGVKLVTSDAHAGLRVRTLLHSVFDQPDAESVSAQGRQPSRRRPR